MAFNAKVWWKRKELFIQKLYRFRVIVECHRLILKVPYNTPYTHIYSPSFPLFSQSGQSGVPFLRGKKKKKEICGLASSRFSPLIHALLAGLPRFQASAVSPQSPVLNPSPCGTFTWPTSESPFTAFLPTRSLLCFSKLLRELCIAATSCFPAS